MKVFRPLCKTNIKAAGRKRPREKHPSSIAREPQTARKRSSLTGCNSFTPKTLRECSSCKVGYRLSCQPQPLFNLSQ